MAFFTPREMFENQLQDWDSEYQREKDYYKQEMHTYALEAKSLIKEELKNEKYLNDYVESFAFSFMDEISPIEALFQRLGLELIHAYAILGDFESFEEEFDRFLQDRYESQYM